MLDTMLLLRRASSLRWSTVLGWLDGAAAASSVYLMLAYLHTRGLVTLDATILHELRRRQTAFGPAGLRIAFRLLDRYVFDDRPPGFLGGPRALALLWTFLLQHGSRRRKLRSMSSRLAESGRRRWSRLFRAPR
jgi:hypothetical protein